MNNGMSLMPNFPGFTPPNMSNGSGSMGGNINQSAAERRTERMRRTVTHSRQIRSTLGHVVHSRSGLVDTLKQWGIDLLTSAKELDKTGDFVAASYVIYRKHRDFKEPLFSFLQRYPDFATQIKQIEDHAQNVKGKIGLNDVKIPVPQNIQNFIPNPSQIYGSGYNQYPNYSAYDNQMNGQNYGQHVGNIENYDHGQVNQMNHPGQNFQQNFSQNYPQTQIGGVQNQSQNFGQNQMGALESQPQDTQNYQTYPQNSNQNNQYFNGQQAGQYSPINSDVRNTQNSIHQVNGNINEQAASQQMNIQADNQNGYVNTRNNPQDPAFYNQYSQNFQQYNNQTPDQFKNKDFPSNTNSSIS